MCVPKLAGAMLSPVAAMTGIFDKKKKPAVQQHPMVTQGVVGAAPSYGG